MNGVLETRRQIIFNRRQSGVAFLLLDCPGKLNYLGTAVMRELDEVLAAVRQDKTIKALVLMSGKADHFVIGADLFEIRKAKTAADLHKLSSQGHQTLNNIAGLNIPVIMAINGICLGGGLELALAGHWRIAGDSPETMLGLPEIRLGILPGMGGTQRLPRVIGLKAALGLILTAEPVSVEEALKMNLIDEHCPPGDLMDVAEQRAVELMSDPSRVKERMQQWAEPLLQKDTSGVKATKWCLNDLDEEKGNKLFAMTERSVRIKTRGKYPAQTRVLDVMKIGLAQGVTAGLAAEANAFAELASSDIAANLISLFFATDFAKQSARSTAIKFGGDGTKKVGIIGGGTMGSSIAALSAAHGLDVLMKVNPGREEQARESLRLHQQRIRPGSPADGPDSLFAHLNFIDNYEKLANAQLVLESVNEDLALKADVLKNIESHVGPDCTIASNTSSIPLASLSQSLEKDDRFVGLHFFHPADKMTLVEIISLKTTSRKALARAADYVLQLGKIPVMVKDGSGFLINRLLTCYLLETARMVEEGVPLNWIDECAVEFGMPMGPLALLDEVGLDLAVTIAEKLHESFGERMRPPAILQAVPKLGLVGKKTGSGMYLWDDTGRRREFNPDLFQLPGFKVSPEKAPEDRRRAIAEQLIFPMIDEAARCLEEKIVMKPREIDMAIIHGIGFPPFRGGILKYADKIGLKEVQNRLTDMYGRKQHAERHLSQLLQRYVSEGRTFYSRGKEDE